MHSRHALYTGQNGQKLILYIGGFIYRTFCPVYEVLVYEVPVYEANLSHILENCLSGVQGLVSNGRLVYGVQLYINLFFQKLFPRQCLTKGLKSSIFKNLVQTRYFLKNKLLIRA